MSQHQACLDTAHCVFHNDGLGLFDLDLRQLCRTLCQCVRADRNARCDEPCDKFGFFVQYVKSVGCAIVNDHRRAAVNFIGCHQIDDTVCPNAFGVVPFDGNACFHANADDHGLNMEIFPNALCQRIHNIRHNRRNDDRVNAACLYIGSVKEGMDKDTRFICGSDTGCCHTPALNEFIPAVYPQNIVGIPYINYQKHVSFLLKIIFCSDSFHRAGASPAMPEPGRIHRRFLRFHQ